MDDLDIKVKNAEGTIYRANVWETNKAHELGYCRWAVYKWMPELSWWYKIDTDGRFHTVDRAIVNALVSLPDVFCDCGGQYRVNIDEWVNAHLECEHCASKLPDWDTIFEESDVE